MRQLIFISLTTVAAALLLPACESAGPAATPTAAALYTGTPDPTPVVVTLTPTSGPSPTPAGTPRPTVTPPTDAGPGLAPEEIRTAAGQAAGTASEGAEAEAAQEAETPAGAAPQEAEAPAGEGTPEAEDQAAAGGEAMSEQELLDLGQQVYSANCSSCHQPGGTGAANFPALQGNDFVTGDPIQVIQVVLNGRNAMPGFGGVLSDQEVAAVVSHIRTSWGNEAPVVQVEQVQAAQGSAAAR